MKTWTVTEGDIGRLAQYLHEAADVGLAGVHDKPKVCEGLVAALDRLDSPATLPRHEQMARLIESRSRALNLSGEDVLKLVIASRLNTVSDNTFRDIMKEWR